MANGHFLLGDTANDEDRYLWKVYQANIKKIILQSLMKKEKCSVQQYPTGTDVWYQLCMEMLHQIP